jgi:hypothetical protein
MMDGDAAIPCQPGVQTLFLVTSVIPLNVGVLLWLMWWTDARLDLHTQQKALESRGKIPTAGATDPPRVMVKGHLFGAAVREQELYHRFESRLRVKIWVNLRAFRSSEVPASTKLHTSTTCCCLPSPLGSGRTVLASLRIDLNLFQRIMQWLWLMLENWRRGQETQLGEQFPHGAGGTRETNGLFPQLGITWQGVQNGSRAWCAL